MNTNDWQRHWSGGVSGALALKYRNLTLNVNPEFLRFKYEELKACNTFKAQLPILTPDPYFLSLIHYYPHSTSFKICILFTHLPSPISSQILPP